MSKPILLARIPNIFIVEKDNLEMIVEQLESATEKEYHVIVVQEDAKRIEFETYNDIKGLTDIDIEKLIESIK